MKNKAIFLTHPQLLRSTITGGVQLCSQEFHYILDQLEEIQLEDYYIDFTKRISPRAKIKLGVENYSGYDVGKDSPALLQYIADHQIGIVFLNMASTVRYSRPIKERFGDSVKTILLSHGNYSGDFLHLITRPPDKLSSWKRMIKTARLGKLIATESAYRVQFLDGVVALSETEKEIENWLGARKTSFLPRRLYKDFLDHRPVKGRVGFVGRLDHPPNLQGVSILLRAMDKLEKPDEFRLVGAPTEFGEKLQKEFPFIQYIGELSDADLEKELATWSFLVNPVWWYATGASTKLAKAISWGLPVITTTAGMRGYEWKRGSLLVADDPVSMAGLLIKESRCMDRVQYWGSQTRLAAENGLEIEELKNRIRYIFQ